MGNLKRVVTEQVLADELPERLREGIEPGDEVTVIVYVEPKPPVADFEAKLAHLWGVGAHYGTTTEEAVARVRALRDEWD